MPKAANPLSIVVYPNLQEDLVLHTRCQHAVGQGGFHTGQLFGHTDRGLVIRTAHSVDVFASAPFQYVYDCGSRQAAHCSAVTRRFIGTCGGRALDLLFLSHFDEDHVNGVPILLDKQLGVKVETIVMPWVDDVERLIAFARAKTRGSKISPFFLALLVDPIEALSVFGPGRILFIRSGPGGPDGEEGEVPTFGPDGEAGFRVKLISGGSGDRSKSRGGSFVPSGVGGVIIADHDTALGVSVASSNASWLFKPYVHPADPTLVKRFEREVEQRFGWPWYSFRTKVKDKAIRLSLTTDRAKSRILADAYKAAFGNRNLTSLCIYSGPDLYRGHQPALMIELGRERCRRVKKIGWLGTGDVPLANPSDAHTFLDHFQEQHGDVATFGLPHHGAKANHSMHVIGLLRPASCYAPAKPPRNWKHPHPDVFSDVESLGGRAVHVSDRDSTSLNEAFAVLM